MEQPERGKGKKKKRGKRKRENFPAKSSNLRHCWGHSQNKGLTEYKRRARQLPTGPLPTGGREAGGWQPEPEGKGQTRPQRQHPCIKLWAGSQLLIKSSWDPGWLTSTRRVAARDQLPRGDTRYTWDSAPTVHPGNWTAGTREVISHTAPGESVLTKHLVAWPAQTWEGHKMQAQSSLCLYGVPKNLNMSSIDLGSARNPGPALDSSPAEQRGAWAV